MSIWKTPDQKPDKNEPIIIRNWAGVLYSIPCMPFPTMREDRTWAYLREVVAQADKAERLQKAVEEALAIYNADTSIHADKDCITMIKKTIKQLIKE